jgi:hypothetical protein
MQRRAGRAWPPSSFLVNLAQRDIRAYTAAMSGFIYFDITDHARLPARFFGMTRSVLARA